MLTKLTKNLNKCIKDLSKRVIAKLLFYFIVSITIIMTLFVTFFVNEQKELIKAQVVIEGRNDVKILAKSIKLGVYMTNAEILDSHIQDFTLVESILDIVVFDNKTDVIRNARKDKPVKATDDDIMIMKKISANRKIIENEYFHEIEFWAPVMFSTGVSNDYSLYRDLPDNKELPEEIIGFVKVVFDKRKLIKSTDTIMLKSVFISFSLVIMFIAIAFFILEKSLKSITNLTKQVTQYEKDSTYQMVKVSSDDEIGQLVKSVCNLMGTLKERETEKRNLEKELRNAEKLDAIGRFTRNIAHDFNNLLTVVTGQARTLQLKLPADHFAHTYLNNMVKSSEVASSHVKSLFEYCIETTLTLTQTSVNELIVLNISYLRGLIPDNVKIILNITQEDTSVTADLLKINQLLTNIIINACDAMPQGGLITISTSLAEISTEIQKIHKLDGLKFTKLVISDTGEGITEENARKIFEPFFSTKKDSGKGAGLGLSIVIGVVKQHGGFISVESKVGHGTSFNIYLPYNRDFGQEQYKEHKNAGN